MSDQFEFDPFRFDDAAYVLGALDEDARLAFEQHLTECDACLAGVAELRGVPAALGTVSTEEIGPEVVEDAVPETLLPGLVRHAAAERRRRHFGVAALGTLAAACLVVLAVVLWPSSSTHARQQTMTALATAPVAATVELESTSWGTQIRLDCRYTATVSTSYAYGLTVIDTAGNAHDLGAWSLAPEKSIEFTSGTEVPLHDIAKVQITAGGAAVLQLVT
ncbi:MAG TPA: zf-HC2 domain-containing protein [Jatrophihabitans sp.]|jgi:anti-sigma-K factor RskA